MAATVSPIYVLSLQCDLDPSSMKNWVLHSLLKSGQVWDLLVAEKMWWKWCCVTFEARLEKNAASALFAELLLCLESWVTIKRKKKKSNYSEPIMFWKRQGNRETLYRCSNRQSRSCSRLAQARHEWIISGLFQHQATELFTSSLPRLKTLWSKNKVSPVNPFWKWATESKNMTKLLFCTTKFEVVY